MFANFADLTHKITFYEKTSTTKYRFFSNLHCSEPPNIDLQKYLKNWPSTKIGHLEFLIILQYTHLSKENIFVVLSHDLNMHDLLVSRLSLISKKQMLIHVKFKMSTPEKIRVR